MLDHVADGHGLTAEGVLPHANLRAESLVNLLRSLQVGDELLDLAVTRAPLGNGNHSCHAIGLAELGQPLGPPALVYTSGSKGFGEILFQPRLAPGASINGWNRGPTWLQPIPI
jgi:hypothetical protein